MGSHSTRRGVAIALRPPIKSTVTCGSRFNYYMGGRSSYGQADRKGAPAFRYKSRASVRSSQFYLKQQLTSTSLDRPQLKLHTRKG